MQIFAWIVILQKLPQRGHVRLEMVQSCVDCISEIVVRGENYLFLHVAQRLIKYFFRNNQRTRQNRWNTPKTFQYSVIATVVSIYEDFTFSNKTILVSSPCVDFHDAKMRL